MTKRYQHVTEEMMRDIASRLDGLIREKNGTGRGAVPRRVSRSRWSEPEPEVGIEPTTYRLQVRGLTVSTGSLPH
jgi:hypothetical protein